MCTVTFSSFFFLCVCTPVQIINVKHENLRKQTKQKYEQIITLVFLLSNLAVNSTMNTYAGTINSMTGGVLDQMKSVYFYIFNIKKNGYQLSSSLP